MKISRVIVTGLFSGVIVFFGLGFKDVRPPTKYQFPELKYFPKMPVAEDNPVTAEGAALGRYLFYDPILSLDSTISCSSCHKQAFAFSDYPNRFSKGITGEKLTRNTMPLFNLAWYPAMHWDGKAASIEKQVFLPVSAHNEMNLDWSLAEERIRNSDFYRNKFYETFGKVEIDSVLIAKAIAQFERTLISNNSKYDQILRGKKFFTKDEYEGFVMVNDMTKGGCLHCHTTDGDALGTTGRFSNNGLDPVLHPSGYPDKGRGGVSGKISDQGLFKIPSLRNVAVTGPYMHDGRFQTLQEVLDFYSEGVNVCANIDSKMEFAYRGGAHLTDDEKLKIMAFLHTLTDSIFLSNPEFSNPFN
jgi:cytochrome c peroxidase